MSKKQKKKHLHRHHRRCRSNGGSDDSIVLVDRDKHAAWHLLFKNYEALMIADIINTTWLDPAWVLVAKRR